MRSIITKTIPSLLAAAIIAIVGTLILHDVAIGQLKAQSLTKEQYAALSTDLAVVKMQLQDTRLAVNALNETNKLILERMVGRDR